jgi:hypothetical protein
MEGVIKVIHLSSGVTPSLGDAPVCIRRSENGAFQIEVIEVRRRPLVRFESNLVSFDAALEVAQRHAERLGVATIYAIGCREA